MKFVKTLPWNGIAFVLVIGTLAHLVFSWAGFVAADDGFVLSASRRILDGQVPHRDFIWIRPIGSPLLFVPVVWLGGDYTLWIARFFVWLEWACIAWLWTQILLIMLKHRADRWTQWLVAFLSFVFCVHNTMIMPWYTNDALLLIAIGIRLSLSGAIRLRYVGYALIAASALCKQNFLVVPLVALLLSRDVRKPGAWVAAATPFIAYGLMLLFTGALQDFLLQMNAHTDLVRFGVRRYIVEYALPWGILGGWVSALLMRKDALFARMLGAGMAVAVPLGILLLLGLYPGASSFALLGVIIGLLGASLKLLPFGAQGVRALLLVTAVAWAASISTGYNTPALMNGPMWTLLFFVFSLHAPAPIFRPRMLLVLCTLIALVTFAWARFYRPLRELTLPHITASLGGVLPGAAGISSNENTVALFTDLTAAIALAQGKTYAVLPDLAAVWVKAEQQNPLPMDWPFLNELPTPALMQRFTHALDNARPGLVVIVQKVRVDVAYGFRPVSTDDQPILDHVRSTFTKTGETQYFELYE